MFAGLCRVTQSCLTLCNTIDCSLLGASVHGDSPGKNTGVGCHALLQGSLPNPGIKDVCLDQLKNIKNFFLAHDVQLSNLIF